MPRFPVARAHAAPFALAASLAMAARCAPLPNVPRPAPASIPISRMSYVLTAPDLPTDQYNSLHDALDRKWPDLLYGTALRGAEWPPMAAPVERDLFAVYDSQGAFLGGPDYLRGVMVSAVTRVQRLTAIEEYTAFGRRHTGGAVVVTWAPGFRR